MKNGCRETLPTSVTWASVTTLLMVNSISSGVAWMETSIMGPFLIERQSLFSTVGLPGDWLTGGTGGVFLLVLSNCGQLCLSLSSVYWIYVLFISGLMKLFKLRACCCVICKGKDSYLTSSPSP